MVDIGMEAFLPGSQIDNKRIKNLDEYLDKTYDFKILKINIDRKNIVVSRRELLEAERISRKLKCSKTSRWRSSRRHREEHHRLRRLLRPRWHRWPSAYHRYDLEAYQAPF